MANELAEEEEKKAKEAQTKEAELKRLRDMYNKSKSQAAVNHSDNAGGTMKKKKKDDKSCAICSKEFSLFRGKVKKAIISSLNKLTCVRPNVLCVAVISVPSVLGKHTFRNMIRRPPKFA